MPDPSAEHSPRRHTASTAALISSAVVRLLHEYTGRGPTQARTTIDANTIVVTLRDSLTKAERTLASTGQATEVLAMRRAFQTSMREDLIEIVERLTGRTVEAFLSDNLHEPDVAVEVFIMQHDDSGARGA